MTAVVLMAEMRTGNGGNGDAAMVMRAQVGCSGRGVTAREKYYPGRTLKSKKN